MANHKSAEKRNRQNLVRRMRNRANRSRVKTMMKAVEEAIAQNAPDKAQEALREAIPVIHRASNKGAFHKKNASRKVSRLTKRVNSLLGAGAAG